MANSENTSQSGTTSREDIDKKAQLEKIYYDYLANLRQLTLDAANRWIDVQRIYGETVQKAIGEMSRSQAEAYRAYLAKIQEAQKDPNRATELLQQTQTEYVQAVWAVQTEVGKTMEKAREECLRALEEVQWNARKGCEGTTDDHLRALQAAFSSIDVTAVDAETLVLAGQGIAAAAIYGRGAR